MSFLHLLYFKVGYFKVGLYWIFLKGGINSLFTAKRPQGDLLMSLLFRCFKTKGCFFSPFSSRFFFSFSFSCSLYSKMPQPSGASLWKPDQILTTTRVAQKNYKYLTLVPITSPMATFGGNTSVMSGNKIRTTGRNWYFCFVSSAAICRLDPTHKSWWVLCGELNATNLCTFIHLTPCLRSDLRQYTNWKAESKKIIQVFLPSRSSH